MGIDTQASESDRSVVSGRSVKSVIWLLFRIGLKLRSRLERKGDIKRGKKESSDFILTSLRVKDFSWLNLKL